MASFWVVGPAGGNWPFDNQRTVPEGVAITVTYGPESTP